MPIVGPGLAPGLPTLAAPWLTGLRDWLRAEPSVVALAGARIYVGALPLGSTLPALAISRVGGGMGDTDTEDLALVQVEAWAGGGAAAETLITTVVAAMGSAPPMTALTVSTQLMGAALNSLVWAPDPDTDTARYIATMDAHVRVV